MRQTLVAGNWKLNGSLQSVKELISGIKAGAGEAGGTQIAVCPPFVYIPLVSELLAGSSIAWGSQDVSDQESGAFTGEISAAMLQEFGCRYAIVGHSERRALYAEDDEFTARKFAAARKAGLTPILCVGETLEEREAGRTMDVVGRQVDAILKAVSADEAVNVVIAYEPVWAIGTGKTATPEIANEAHTLIRNVIADIFGRSAADGVSILYGGSVKPENTASLMAESEVDGVLVGGASLEPGSFAEIVKAAA